MFELVYFLRLELRKGLALFCDTLDQLMRTPKVLQSVTVTFLGRISDAERVLMRGGVTIRADEYIKMRAKKWTFPWQILKDMDVQARNSQGVGSCELYSEHCALRFRVSGAPHSRPARNRLAACRAACGTWASPARAASRSCRLSQRTAPTSSPSASWQACPWCENGFPDAQ